MEQRLLDLIESTSFAHLSPADQELVLAHMTEEEYDDRHALARQVSHTFDMESPGLSPDPNTLFSLQEALAAKRKPKGITAMLSAVLAVRIPAYQVGLAAVLLLFAGYFYNSTPMEATSREIVYQTVHDTVEVIREVEVPVELIVEKPVEVVRYVERDSEPSIQLVSNAIPDQGITPQASVPDLASVQQSFGNTALDAKALEQFQVGL